MDLGIAGKRALVLGASRGLGRAIATALAAEGAEVVLAARNRERLADVAAAITTPRARAEIIDLADEASVNGLAQRLLEAGGVDILVNNTGGPPTGSVRYTGDTATIRIPGVAPRAATTNRYASRR